MTARSNFPFLLLFVLLAGCRLTDHTENDAVTTNDLTFPASGYADVDEDEMPRIAFDSTAFDFGRVVQGARVERIFTFTNSGTSPLVITDVRGTCGCTVGKDWPKTPIAPGGGGSITVSFDSEGREGVQHKTVTVLANSVPPSTVLTLTGEVVGPTSAN